MNSVRTHICSLAIAGALMLSIILAPLGIGHNPADEINDTPAGWSNEINLSDSDITNVNSQITGFENKMCIVWEQFDPSPKNYIVYTYSDDEGRTWSPLKNVSNTNYYALNPDVGVNSDNVHVVWDDYREGDSIIYYRNSSDNGETWNFEKRIPTLTPRAGDAKLFVNNSNVHIIWHDKRDGSDGEIYYRRSLDGGITFDNGQGLDEDRRVTFSPAAISGIQMAGDGSNISVAWADERDGDWEVYWMISKDNGFTWEDGLGTPNVGRKISNSADDSVGRAIAVEGSNIHFVWREEQWPGPVYEIYYRNSTDNGATWNPIKLLSGPNTASFATNIDVCGDNVWVMWNDNRDGSHEIFLKNSSDGGISWSLDVRLTGMDGHNSGGPKVALNGTHVHVIWGDYRDGNREIYYKRYPDFPDTSPPDHTNETPLPDSYKDAPGTNVSVHVTDPSGVNESTIQLFVNGSFVSHTLTPITDAFNVSYESPGFDPGVVECRIVADDNCSNTLDYTWNFTVLALYEIQLHEGWNLISVPYVQVDASMNEVLRDIDGKWDYILWYDASDPTDKWKSNATSKPQQLNDLFYLDRGMAFWINITEPGGCNLTIRGHISTFTEIPLYAGWNMVGYPTQTTETVGNALWGTGADKVEVFNASAPYNVQAVDANYVMKPGEGYWVHVPANSVWIIDW